MLFEFFVLSSTNKFVNIQSLFVSSVLFPQKINILFGKILYLKKECFISSSVFHQLVKVIPLLPISTFELNWPENTDYISTKSFCKLLPQALCLPLICVSNNLNISYMITVLVARISQGSSIKEGITTKSIL